MTDHDQHTMIINVSEVPATVRESVRATISSRAKKWAPHGFTLARLGPSGELEAITPEQFEALLGELGRNAAQALYACEVETP